MLPNSQILKNTEDFASQILKNKLPNTIFYHTYQHTAYVVEAAQKIALQSNLGEEDTEIVALAAWMHDIGYSIKSKGHEDESIRLGRDFFTTQQISDEKQQKVIACIEATKIPQNPTSPTAEVLCDADLFHLSADNFFEICEPLRQEWETESGEKMSEIEWLEINAAFLTKHRYFTAYGKAVLEDKKAENLKKVNKSIKKLKKKRDEQLASEMGINEDEFKVLKKKLNKVEGKPERGVETVFRITSTNHIDLSTMADSKANIMISVNAIIISVIISMLMQKLDTNPHLIIPTSLLLFTNMLAIVFAILATRPNVTSGTFTKIHVEQRKANLLFFGNFHQMKLEDYEWGMRELLEDKDYLYGSLIRDIYFLGVVLGKKYRLLRISYTIFMYGLIVSVLAFIIAGIFFATKPTGASPTNTSL